MRSVKLRFKAYCMYDNETGHRCRGHFVFKDNQANKNKRIVRNYLRFLYPFNQRKEKIFTCKIYGHLIHFLDVFGLC